MIVYLARLLRGEIIPPFVMYCVYEASRSSLLIEYTESMIIIMIKIVLCRRAHIMYGMSIHVNIGVYIHMQYFLVT